MNEIKTPWLKNYGGAPATLDYFEGSMSDAFERTARDYSGYIAYEFMGGKTSYRAAFEAVKECAAALIALGIRPGDKVTICLPNLPQAVTMFYAVNMIGAVSNMVHPLSGEGEIAFYLKDSGSVAAITLDQFYEKFERVRRDVKLKHLIITSVADALSPIVKAGYALTEGRKIKKIPAEADIVRWKDFLAAGRGAENYAVKTDRNAPAAILYSGGTTGTNKGIILSSLNFNALAQQIISFNPMFEPGDRMLAVMPVFHGFGLGVSIHAMIFFGGRCILVPRFTAKSYVGLMARRKPNFVAGVPTLFEAMLREPEAQKLDLSCLKGIFSGGDSLSIELKKRFDAYLKERGSTVEIREGYGTTETVTACCLTPINMSREGSIGLPLPDTFFKIVKPETDEELSFNEEGEIVIAGPSVMLGYNNQSEETAKTLRVHPDGLTWVHTGDLGVMDEDGFVYFRQRIKRMIITSGYNVYPSRIENLLDAHEYVQMSCVIGVKDPLKIQKVKACIMLKAGFEPSEAIKQELLEYCRRNIAVYAVPYDIEFRESLPKTLVGKVAYRELEEEERLKEQA